MPKFPALNIGVLNSSIKPNVLLSFLRFFSVPDNVFPNTTHRKLYALIHLKLSGCGVAEIDWKYLWEGGCTEAVQCSTVVKTYL